MSVFSVKNLNFTYPQRKIPALRDINIEIDKGKFVLICGKSGCGKSTLLRHLKPVLTPHGEKSGEIKFGSKNIDEVDAREQASKIGYVLQSPDNQIVTDKVWHELAFGLENLGYDNKSIRLRVAEMASFFGIQTWFLKNVSELSGGQKQLLNLAAIMTMQPEVLIFDEPTSQLDPIAKGEFLQTIKKINTELGTTIVMSEHNLEDAFNMADEVIVMDDGRIIARGEPKAVGQRLHEIGSDMFSAVPTPMKIAIEVEKDLARLSTMDVDTREFDHHGASRNRESQESESKKCENKKYKSEKCESKDCEIRNLSEIPINVKEGRFWLEKMFRNREITCKINDLDYREKNNFTVSNRHSMLKLSRNRKPSKNEKFSKNKKIRLSRHENKSNLAISVKGAWFRYEKNEDDVVRDLSIDIETGKFHCIVGGNGTGKTTSLYLMSGMNKVRRGSVEIFGKNINKYSKKELYSCGIAVLPQNPQTLFTKKNVELDLLEMLSDKKIDKDNKRDIIQSISDLVGIGELMNSHPYDLSGGEQQKLALAKVLLLEPRILLLDEPTKGFDSEFNDRFAEIIEKLKDRGVTVVMVTHDIEFCARYADKCSLFFNGNIVTTDRPREFFSGNSFYTTVANRMSRGYFEEAITSEDVIDLCKKNLDLEKELS
ncbi:MAG: ATP-binding cassette domain-containing protein [Clostridioides sp.]|jgi:energy-coupling factor transport system ATP-binding protein|nr:ATP-binding cassette domain-containing protein [Clostridioides sp.]